MGMRAMPEGPVRRFRRFWVVRGRGSKRFFFFSPSSFLSLSAPPLAGGPPSIPGGTFPIVSCVGSLKSACIYSEAQSEERQGETL